MCGRNREHRYHRPIMRSPDHARTGKLRGSQGALEVGNLSFYQYSLSSVIDLRRDKRDLAPGNVFAGVVYNLNG